MALTKDQIKTTYPLPVYNYKVEIDGNTVGFSEVTGLSIGYETATYVESGTSGVGPRRTKQQMVGLMAAQHVVDQIGRDGDLAARFFLAGKAPLDQAGDDRTVAKRALHQRRLGEPGFQIVAEHVFIEQRGKRKLTALEPQRHIAETPDSERIFVGDEAHRL